MRLNYSIIIPVYNRPEELDELLSSILEQDYIGTFEICVIEDGSQQKCNLILEKFTKKLTIKYFEKENSGPGDSRNFGMKQANGNYYIILDSDVILPKQYLSEVNNQLTSKFTDAFGGPDAAHPNFTSLQKAINYSMTSFLTTGGIRGKKKGLGKFQPRSFNMGISKAAFEKTKGFSDMRAGEDIDLTFRIWENGFETQLVDKAFVYHKRRNTIRSFYKQTFAFGTARPILNRKYPQSAKLTYWFPSLFIIGLDISLLLLLLGYHRPFLFYFFYFSFISVDSFLKNYLNPWIGFLSTITSLTQFLGYGLGFLESQLFSKKR